MDLRPNKKGIQVMHRTTRDLVPLLTNNRSDNVSPGFVLLQLVKYKYHMILLGLN